jgi:hypothetical protein
MADSTVAKTLLFLARSTMGRESCVMSVAGWGKENIVLKTGDALDNMAL